MFPVPGYDELRPGGEGALEDPVVRRVVLDHTGRLHRFMYSSGDSPDLSYGPLGPVLLPAELLRENTTDLVQYEGAGVQLHHAPPDQYVGEIRPSTGPVIRRHQNVRVEDDPGNRLSPSGFRSQRPLPVRVESLEQVLLAPEPALRAEHTVPLEPPELLLLAVVLVDSHHFPNELAAESQKLGLYDD